MIADNSKTTRIVLNRVQLLASTIITQITDDVESNPFRIGNNIGTDFFKG